MTVREHFKIDAEASAQPHGIAAYLQRGLTTIEGWGVDALAARLFLAIDRFQELNGEAGNLFEIGVLPGRSAILMALMARPDERAVFLHVAGRRDGDAALQIFEQNLTRWAPGRLVDVPEDDGAAGDFAAIASLRSGVRLAHLDAGGSRETVLNDLLKVEHLLTPGGVVIVNAFGHPAFPGVREGCDDYLQSPSRRLAPVAQGRDKLVLARSYAAERLRVFLAGVGGEMSEGPIDYHGGPTLRLDGLDFPTVSTAPPAGRPLDAIQDVAQPQTGLHGASERPTAGPALSGLSLPQCVVCRYEHFTQDWYRYWAPHLHVPTLEVTPAMPVSYRKAWEWAAILQVLDERGMLRPGRRGMGFAVGQERLASIFASRGVEVLASDLYAGEAAGVWADTGQHAASLEALFHPQQVDRETFDRLVSFQAVDMNDLEGLPSERFDFLWSSCAIEHLGTLEKGLDFVCNAMRLLKPGGIAVHTTEYNVSSNEKTVEVGDNCIYRQRDLETLDRRLRRMRCGLEPMDFNAGTHRFDLDYDTPPYFEGERVHIKLDIAGFVCASYLLIAVKGA